MGYYLYITRREDHGDEDGPEITAEEWLEYIRDDRELDLAGINGDYFTYWSGPSAHPEAWFNWMGGDIHAKNPDDAMIEKMVQIANELNAKVQGDDGEIYLSGGVILNGPKVADVQQSTTPKSWWRRLWDP